MKMYTRNKKWIVIDGEREIVFDTAMDAFRYTFLMRDVKPKTLSVPQSCYPVTTLIPSRKKKKVIYKRGETESV